MGVKKKLEIILFLIVIMSCMRLQRVFSEELTELEKKIFSNSSPKRNIENNFKFKSEKLKFKLWWEFIYAGESETSCEMDIVENRKIWHITTNTKSSPAIDIIYKMRNRTDSCVDYEGMYSLKFVKNQLEGNFVSEEYVLFDNENGKWYSKLKDKSGEMSLFVQDIVSSLYFLRTQNLKLTERYKIDVYTSGVIYPMIVEVLAKETLTIKGKKYSCFKVEPKIDEEKFGLFKLKGKLWVWLTDDDKCLPVKLQTKVFIGSVYALLDEVVVE